MALVICELIVSACFFVNLRSGDRMAKMGWFLGGFLVLTIGIGILATIPPG